MNAVLIFVPLCLLLNSVSRQTCYQINVAIEDGVKNENVEFEVVDKEIPPFEVPVTRAKVRHMFQEFGSSTKQEIGKTWNGLLGNARVKRSSKWCNVTEKVSRAVTVAKDGIVHLPCHRCVDDSDELYAPMQWVKLHPNPDRKGLYLLKEILSDMHDDERRNNLVITLDHTLVIRKTRRTDTASYICKPFTNNEFLRKRINSTGLQKWITEDSHVRYFYHLDVLDFDKTPMVETGGDSERMAIAPRDMIPENIIVFTKWLPWSSCSLCDQHGLKQRIGLCVIKKRVREVNIPHAYLNNILDFATNGLPCHSEFLKEFEHRAWLNRPNEIQFAECYEPCPKTIHRKKRSTISSKEFSRDSDEGKKKKVIKTQVDKYLILKCPGSKILRKPVWMRGSKTISPVHIRNITKRRVNFDIFGSLHFIKVKRRDSGIYSCWIEKKLKKKFHVRVRENPFKEVKRYGWLLGATLMGDFLLFLFLSIVKRCHRRVQVRKKTKEKKQPSVDKIKQVGSVAQQISSRETLPSSNLK